VSNDIKKVYLKSFGCQMNDSDSQVMEAMLAAKGWKRVSGEAEADVVLVNTCTVRQSAEQRALGRISQLQRLKQLRPEIAHRFMNTSILLLRVRGALPF